MNDLLQSMFEHGLISVEDIIAVREKCAASFENPVHALRSLKIADANKIQLCLQRYLHFQIATDAEIQALDARFSELIPEDIATELRVFCMGGHTNRIVVAMEDPSDRALRRKLEFFLERKIIPVAATDAQINTALTKLYKYDPVKPVKAEPSKASSTSAPQDIDYKVDDIDLVTQKVAASTENAAAAKASVEATAKASKLQEQAILADNDDLFGGFEDETPVMGEGPKTAGDKKDSSLQDISLDDLDSDPLAEPTIGLDSDPFAEPTIGLDSDLLAEPTMSLEADPLTELTIGLESDPLTAPAINLELSNRLASAFVKVGFTKNFSAGLAVVNEKLSDLSIQIEALDTNKFTINLADRSLEVDLSQPEQTDTAGETFVPILKTLTRLAKSA